MVIISTTNEDVARGQRITLSAACCYSAHMIKVSPIYSRALIHMMPSLTSSFIRYSSYARTGLTDLYFRLIISASPVSSLSF